MHEYGRKTSYDAKMKRIDYMMYHRNDIKKAVSAARTKKSLARTGGGNGHAYMHDDTAIRAIANADKINVVKLENGDTVQHAEDWINVIAATYENSGSMQRKLITLKYENDEKIESICVSLDINSSIYQSILDSIRSYAIAAACQQGIMKVMR